MLIIFDASSFSLFRHYFCHDISFSLLWLLWLSLRYHAADACLKIDYYADDFSFLFISLTPIFLFFITSDGAAAVTCWCHDYWLFYADYWWCFSLSSPFFFRFRCWCRWVSFHIEDYAKTLMHYCYYYYADTIELPHYHFLRHAAISLRWCFLFIFLSIFHFRCFLLFDIFAGFLRHCLFSMPPLRHYFDAII